MVKKELKEVERSLRYIAKRNKNITYSIGLVLMYLMLGINAFSEEVTPKVESQVASKQEISTSTDRLSEVLRDIKTENDKKLKGAQLELIQLMEQGDQVVKSPWASWQFGMNYMYSNWSGTYRGRGDKAQKYPFEGVYTRSRDLFLRNISPDSDLYEEYTAKANLIENFKNPATTSAMKKHRLHYGLEDVNTLQEPVLQIELGASVKPKEVVKNPVSVTPPSIQIGAVSPLNTPAVPVPPTPPVIAIEEFNPVAPDPITVSLPTPPTFNIKLGSYRNYMTQPYIGDIDGGRHSGDGLSYDTTQDIILDKNTANLVDGSPTVIYAWKSPSAYVQGTGFNSALLKAYFDYTNLRPNIASSVPGKTLILKKDLTIDSIRGNIQDPDPVARPWNNQAFLVGGSRVATLDNAWRGNDATKVGGGTLRNEATINLVGPLVVGFEMQNDNTIANAKRELNNSGTITDKAEEGYRGSEGLGGLIVGKTGGVFDPGNAINLKLAPNLGGIGNPAGIDVGRTPDVVDNLGNVITPGGYTGYKVGLILTHEFDTPSPATNFYRLINDGTIKFNGKSSIGIQVYAPPVSSPNTRVEVINKENTNGNGLIELGGIESYGLKLSSRILKEAGGNKSIFENRGTINITGENKSEDNKNSLSSGIAVIEDSLTTGNKAIRAYKELVKNDGTINVSGGQGNTGMVLILKASDDVVNSATGTINVSGNKNIGMRVDLGSVNTDDNTGKFAPEASNEGTINIIDEGFANIGMVANKGNNEGKAIAYNRKKILFNGTSQSAIGMFSQAGGEITNTEDIKGDNPSLNGTIGMVVNDKDSSGINTGTIELKGTKVTGVYNNLGKFKMTGGSILTSGEKSISLYAKGDSTVSTTETKIVNGTITAEDKALGLFADKTTIELGDTATEDTVTLNAKDPGTLLFYNYTKSGSTFTADGKFKLVNNIKGNITNGATAFYFKDTTPGNSSGQTSDKLNAMFNGSGNNKIKLKLDDKSTLFVLDNTSPNLSYIGLSTVDPSVINNYLGNNVEIDSNSSKNYKAYKATKASLSINSDVDLDNHTGTAIDKYYRVDFLNSNVRVEEGKTITGSDTSKLKQAIAQANFEGATSSSSVKVENNGTIDFSKKGGTAIAVDFGEAINNGTIKMDAANGNGENSVALFGASNSKLVNTGNGEIELGENGVGIWGTNKINSSLSAWDKNINIENAGKIKGINNKSGLFGIFADNNKDTYNSTSQISHTGSIDFSLNKVSTGIFMTNGTLNSSGDISVKEGSVGINAIKSDLNITDGTHTIGKESVGFKISGLGSKFLGTGGNINITDEKSAVYLLENVALESGKDFTDNLTLTSSKAYTYIDMKNSSLAYQNTKVLNNDGSNFMNLNSTQLTLNAGTDISSTKEKVVGIYAVNGSTVENLGKLELTGNESSAIYAEDTSTVINGATGKIKAGDNGSGVYVKNSYGTNKGDIEIGANSVGMRMEVGGKLQNLSTGKIHSVSEKAVGMSQSGGTQDLENEGTITLIGDKSIGMHSEGVAAINHNVLNSGSITVGNSNSSTTPSIGIYSANGLNSTIANIGKVIAGEKSIALYGKNIALDLNGASASETLAGDGGIAVYSSEGKVEVKEGAKVGVGKSLGKNKEGVAVYLAGDNQTLKSETSNISIGDGSFGFVMTGQNNNITTGKIGNTANVSLGKDSIFLYSADKSGTITNYNNLKSTGDENYGLYVSGPAENRGDIDFSSGVGNVGIYSYLKGATLTPGLVKNYAEIKVSASDVTNPDNKKYGIGMAAGYAREDKNNPGTKIIEGLGNIENLGIIKVTTPDSIGMYATGKGSKAVNRGIIELSGSKKNIGMFIEEGAIGENYGHIKTVGINNKGQIGVVVMKGSEFINHKGATINIEATNGYGLFYVNGAIIKNYGDINIIKKIEASDPTKIMGEGIDSLKMIGKAGEADITISQGGKIKKPEIVDVKVIPNRKPNDIPTSSVGMYIDTSGINYTKPITNIGKLSGLTQADLIIGTEATKFTNSKYIQLSQKMIEPYNEMIKKADIEKWSIYSGSLTWMATITQLPDYSIRNAYLAKVPYTVFANDKNTTRDTYNFADGLEQRYGVEAIGTRENKLFQKLNSIGNNERILLIQAYDEMMGHQYANVQQRIHSTGQILDKEFDYLKDEWRTASKDSNKVKVFGMKGEYSTDTAGVIDYKNNAYGVVYVGENETVKLGNTTGWYTGLVHNTFKFKDIGNSKEEMLQAKLGLFNSKAFDDNNSLNWTISGEAFVGYNKMHRKFLVVDEIFNARSRYWSYGVALKNELSKTFRLSEDFSLRGYGSIKAEYGRFQKIKEKSGEVRLEIKSNDYISIKPEIGGELIYKTPLSGRNFFNAKLGVAYENELGRVGDAKNKARVAHTTADWFNIRGEKEDRRGNVRTDLSLGWDNEAYGITANIGYDTKGKNRRAGLGLRVIF